MFWESIFYSFFGRLLNHTLKPQEKIEILNCETSEIIFNSRGTESDNSLLMFCKDLGINKIISSKIEHHAITHTLDELEKEGGQICKC